MAREESFFDELARGLADGSVTRAKAIRLMGSALVGAALASVPGVAWANDRCSQGQTRCGDRCVNLKTNERHCGSCRNRCGTKQTCCGGRCVNLKRSERHCGSCSNRCEEGQECIDGVCGGEVCQGEFLIPVGGGDPICTCGGPVHSHATSVNQKQFAPMDRLSVAVQPLWLVLRRAPEANQYVLRAAQRDRSAC